MTGVLWCPEFTHSNTNTAVEAAVVDGRVRNVIVEDLPASYRTLATTPIQRQIFDVVLPGVLRRYDLEDLAGAEVIVGQTVARAAGFGRVVRRRESVTIPEAYFGQLR